MDKGEFIDRRVLFYNVEFNILVKIRGDGINFCQDGFQQLEESYGLFYMKYIFQICWSRQWRKKLKGLEKRVCKNRYIF